MTLSKQRVRLHFEKYDCPLYGVQFINDTKLPLKIVSSEAGSNKDSFSFDKDLSAFLKQSVLFFSVLHLRIHNPSQWQRVTFRLTTRSHVRLIEIAVSNLWFGVNKMLSYIYPFHSHDLNINSPHSLPYIAYSVSSENMVLNQTISPSLFFPDSHHMSA